MTADIDMLKRRDGNVIFEAQAQQGLDPKPSKSRITKASKPAIRTGIATRWHVSETPTHVHDRQCHVPCSDSFRLWRSPQAVIRTTYVVLICMYSVVRRCLSSLATIPVERKLHSVVAPPLVGPCLLNLTRAGILRQSQRHAGLVWQSCEITT